MSSIKAIGLISSRLALLCPEMCPFTNQPKILTTIYASSGAQMCRVLAHPYDFEDISRDYSHMILFVSSTVVRCILASLYNAFGPKKHLPTLCQAKKSTP